MNAALLMTGKCSGILHKALIVQIKLALLISPSLFWYYMNLNGADLLLYSKYTYLYLFFDFFVMPNTSFISNKNIYRKKKYRLAEVETSLKKDILVTFWLTQSAFTISDGQKPSRKGKIYNDIKAIFGQMTYKYVYQLKHHSTAQLEAEVCWEQQWRGLRNRGRSPIIQSR